MSIGPLNLSDADLSGFEPLNPGRYNAEVFEITMDATKRDGKVPMGTRMMKIQFKLMDESVINRRVWTQYVIPPEDHPKEKREKMNGMIVRFFIAVGDPEETVRSGSFDPDFEDYKGRPCVVIVGKEPKKDQNGNIIEGEFNNPVKGVKAAGSIVTTGGDDGGLL
jgi:hypothetical protein